MASKQQKISSSPGSQSNSSQDSPTTSSYSQLSLMSPRPALKSLNNDIMTPTQPKREAWQKFVPSPCDASPSSSILKRSNTSDETSINEVVVAAPPLKKRRVQFTDPPVSDQVVIPRCHSGKATRSRFNRDMFLSSVAKDLSSVVTDQAKLSESDNNSCGLYEATPPMTSTHTCNDKPSGTETTPSNCIYPSLNHCDEPVSSILHNLTTKTWSKAAERSLMDHNVKTVGDLSKLTAVKASALRSLRPPSNLVAIKEALRKFEKSWIKRGRDKYTGKKLLQDLSALVEVEEDLTEDEEIKETRLQKMSPVVDDISTPEEEDEVMKEIYERPSPSPPDSIGSSIEAGENEAIPTDTNLISKVTTQDQSGENLSKKEIILKEFLNVINEFSIPDLTGVISKAAQAINAKSL